MGFHGGWRNGKFWFHIGGESWGGFLTVPLAIRKIIREESAKTYNCNEGNDRENKFSSIDISVPFHLISLAAPQSAKSPTLALCPKSTTSRICFAPERSRSTVCAVSPARALV